MTALLGRLRSARDCEDSGMTLVEVVVACVILMILSSGIAGLMLSTFKTTNNDKLRVAASNLAGREVEIVRQYFASGGTAVADVVDPSHTPRVDYYPLQGGTQGQPLVVDNVAFTVTDTVSVQVVGDGASACDGTSGATVAAHPSYLLTVTVTWPHMTNPVKSQTLLTPPKGVVDDSTYGYVAVKVLNAASQPVSGLTVTISGPGGTFTPTTDEAGCAVTAISTPATTYQAALDSSGYVDYYGNPTPVAQNINVEAGKLNNGTRMTYDEAGQIDATFVTASGYNLPVDLPDITLANSGIQPTGLEALPATGATTNLGNLWPFPSGYTIWPGSCNDADPAASGGTRNPPTVLSPGQTTDVQLTLAPLDVTVIDAAGDPVADATVTATEDSGGSYCQADKNLTLGTTDADGHLASSLPRGTWHVSSGGTDSGSFTVGSDPVSAEVDLP